MRPDSALAPSGRRRCRRRRAHAAGEQRVPGARAAQDCTRGRRSFAHARCRGGGRASGRCCFPGHAGPDAAARDRNARSGRKRDPHPRRTGRPGAGRGHPVAAASGARDRHCGGARTALNRRRAANAWRGPRDDGDGRHGHGWDRWRRWHGWRGRRGRARVRSPRCAFGDGGVGRHGAGAAAGVSRNRTGVAAGGARQRWYARSTARECRRPGPSGAHAVRGQRAAPR